MRLATRATARARRWGREGGIVAHRAIRNQNSHEYPVRTWHDRSEIYSIITFSFHHTLRSNRLLFFLGFGGSGATKTSPASSALAFRLAITES